MKKIAIFTLLAAGLISCSEVQQVKTIDVDTFKDLTEKLSNEIILDVRTDSEVAQGVIANAEQIDFSDSSFEVNIERLDKNKPIFIYCAVGGRSGQASKILASKGFKEVYNLDGGINAWLATGNTTMALKK
jgi:phage shock protein E